MRMAVVSDIHGNRTAFEAVFPDLKQTAPDLILHGGDLADSGASPAVIVDRIRELGWEGVVGNTDEMLFAPSRCRNSRNSRRDCSLLSRLLKRSPQQLANRSEMQGSPGCANCRACRRMVR